jgi:hypothetical protein
MLEYIALNWGIIDELPEIWKEAVRVWLKYYPNTYLFDLRGTAVKVYWVLLL